MRFSPLLAELIESFQILPGVGPKTAQRMALHLLMRSRANGRNLATKLALALERIALCDSCRTFCENPLCDICASHQRDTDVLCIVETPSDIIAIEQMNIYRGRYFVLMGHLSPIDGIGPSELGMPVLHKKLNQLSLSELIIATNPTVEGEATAQYIINLAKHTPNLKITRIAHGVPLGGELEFIDKMTLAHAFVERATLQHSDNR